MNSILFFFHSPSTPPESVGETSARRFCSASQSSWTSLPTTPSSALAAASWKISAVRSTVFAGMQA